MRGAKYNPQTTPQLFPEVRIAPLNRHAVALRIAVAIQMGRIPKLVAEIILKRSDSNCLFDSIANSCTVLFFFFNNGNRAFQSSGARLPRTHEPVTPEFDSRARSKQIKVFSPSYAISS
jgi:hypothetical protein